jgi:hypothetical protein
LPCYSNQVSESGRKDATAKTTPLYKSEGRPHMSGQYASAYLPLLETEPESSSMHWPPAGSWNTRSSVRASDPQHHNSWQDRTTCYCITRQVALRHNISTVRSVHAGRGGDNRCFNLDTIEQLRLAYKHVKWLNGRVLGRCQQNNGISSRTA